MNHIVFGKPERKSKKSLVSSEYIEELNIKSSIRLSKKVVPGLRRFQGSSFREF